MFESTSSTFNDTTQPHLQQQQQQQQNHHNQHQNQQPQTQQQQQQKQLQPWQPQQQQWHTVTIRYGEMKYGCLADPVCPMRFGKLEMQAAHHRETHLLRRPYICSVCSFVKNSFQTNEGIKSSFKKKRSLQFHQKNQHKSE